MRTRNGWSVRAGVVVAALFAPPVAAQVTSLLSVDVNGELVHKDAFGGVISFDNRYVGFFCYDNLMNLGTHSAVYLRDRVTGDLECISLNSNEVQGNAYSYGPALSADVRFAVFSSYSNNLVPGDTNGTYPTGHDVFIRDRLNGTTERISVDSLGAQAAGESWGGSISADGRYVAFRSTAGNLVAGDTNAAGDIFVRDRQLGTTVRVSVDSLGGQGNGDCEGGLISADGRYVAFYSSATNLVAGDTNAFIDAFVHDRQTGATVRVSVGAGGTQADGDSYPLSFSSDAQYVVLQSFAANLVAGDTNGWMDVFVHDRQNAANERVSVSSSGTQGNAESRIGSISADGRYVAFRSSADNLVAGDVNTEADIFLRDRQSGTTVRVSVDSNGAEAKRDSYSCTISADGRFVVLATRSGLVEMDTNDYSDVYLRDRDYAALESVCHPGVAGVVGCPCANPPSASGRGCDNSSATGGAILSASGIAHLTQDTLVFTTSGEKPTATSIVLQGSAHLPGGVVYGQGVRCAGGTVKRLYTKSASGGSITAPDFGAGDPRVSVRSESLGHEILPGQNRWYLVYYRDGGVLGGCPATSTFNATQTGQVTWLP